MTMYHGKLRQRNFDISQSSNNSLELLLICGDTIVDSSCLQIYCFDYTDIKKALPPFRIMKEASH
jgi:hypothetical protein